MEHTEVQEVQEVDAIATVLPPRSFDVMRMLSWAFLVEIVAYAALATGSLAFTPVEGAWTIVTEAQKGLMSLMQINLGALAGAVTQRPA